MADRLNRGLPMARWPKEDRKKFAEAFAPATDWLDTSRENSLSPATVKHLEYAYGAFMGSLDSELLSLSPAVRVTRASIRMFHDKLARNVSPVGISIAIQRLYYVMRSMCPPIADWDWLGQIATALRIRAEPLRHDFVLSSDLYPVGISMMDEVLDNYHASNHLIGTDYSKFRDGLMIAVLVEAPMRRGNLAAIDVVEHLEKVGMQWNIHVPGRLVKTRHALDYELSERLSLYVDFYLGIVRPSFEGSRAHNCMWLYHDRPMNPKMIRRYLRKHTLQALGVAVTPHRFRNAAATFISVEDPKNIRMSRDLLGHRSFEMTEKHYVVRAASRLAGRSFSLAVQRAASR
ncbi:tyrosine-type recombinase/integrase [Rhizobium sp. LjRoot254]|uniref:tyrosine-type recombinase/integrase n=1 Tax=Rhizobium sp. LjRoot254 TaxID=3342297 RepID=UPI003ECC3916